MSDKRPAKNAIRAADDSMPSHEWLELLAEAIEDDIAGVTPLWVNGYMADRVRRIAQELKLTHDRLDEVMDAAIEIQQMAEGD